MISALPPRLSRPADPHRGRALLSAGLLAGAALAGLLGCKKHAAAPAASTDVPVHVKPAEARDIPFFVEAFGTLEAYRTVTLIPQVSGLLRAVEFTEGAAVKKGQVLYRIERDPYQQSLDRAAAAVALQQAALKPTRDRLRRSRELNEHKLLAPQDYEALQEAVAQGEANLAAAEADLAQAKLNLDRTVIASPLDGVIGLNPQHAGNLVTAQQTTLASVRQIDPIYVTFTVPGPQVIEVLQARRAGKVQVLATRGDSFDGGRPIAGELEVMDNTIDTRADMITLKGRLPNADHSLWPGEFMQVRLILRDIPDTIVVDEGAVMIGNDGPYLYVVKPDRTVELRNVVLGERDADTVVITSGLKGGEEVVVQGQLNLRNGTRVRVVPAPRTVAAAK